jgi:hypothetical protein
MMSTQATIWKYPLQIADEQVISVPRGCEPLTVQFQEGVLCVWVLADVAADMVNQTVHIHGTNDQTPFNVTGEVHIGSVQEPELPILWHVFWTV